MPRKPGKGQTPHFQLKTYPKGTQTPFAIDSILRQKELRYLDEVGIGDDGELLVDGIDQLHCNVETGVGTMLQLRYGLDGSERPTSLGLGIVSSGGVPPSENATRNFSDSSSAKKREEARHEEMNCNWRETDNSYCRNEKFSTYANLKMMGAMFFSANGSTTSASNHQYSKVTGHIELAETEAPIEVIRKNKGRWANPPKDYSMENSTRPVQCFKLKGGFLHSS